MNLKIFHTADVHLGLRFGSYPEELARKLIEARFETLERMVRLANEERCDLFVVGGDLFDNHRVSKDALTRAARILGQFDRLTLVLPGNHDYVTHQEDDIWKTFQASRQDRVLVLTECRPYPLLQFDLPVCVYAAPCQNKHSKTHAVGWISDAAAELKKDPTFRFHLGLAHGSFEGLTPDTEGDYYPMKKEDLSRAGLDLWLMGHIHLQYPPKPGANDRVYYPATPEPDGFDCRHEGKAWILELGSDRSIAARSVSTGSFRFHHERVDLNSLADVEALRTRFSDPKYLRMLLKLELTGTLPRDEHAQLAALIHELQGNFSFLKTDHSAVSIRLRHEDIDQEFARESFPHRLLTELTKTSDDAEALQLAYELIKSARSGGGGQAASG